MWVKTDAASAEGWMNLDRMDNLHIFEPYASRPEEQKYALRAFNGEGSTTLCEVANRSDAVRVGDEIMRHLAAGRSFVDVAELLEERF